MLLEHVNQCLKRIRAEGLHGYNLPPPEGFLRGIDIVFMILPEQLAKSCRAYMDWHNDRIPDLIAPKTFTEKQVLFKFFAPIPLLSPSDKLRSPAYVPELVRPLVRIPKRIWVSDKAELPANKDIPPGSYYLKSNHSSGTNRRVAFPLTEQERRTLEVLARVWLTRAHSWSLSLWWYEMMERNVYLGEDLGSSDSDAADWKFFVCNGRVEIFQIDMDRSGNHRQTIYDRNGRFIDRVFYFNKGNAVEMPENLDMMVKVAEAIGSNFDFIRVDMFRKGGDIYLGEIGLVPNGAKIAIRSREIDERLGNAWHAPWLGKVDASYSSGHYSRVQTLGWEFG